nr:SH3 domain-containing protein [Lachnospiraceae bacterium]
ETETETETETQTAAEAIVIEPDPQSDALLETEMITDAAEGETAETDGQTYQGLGMIISPSADGETEQAANETGQETLAGFGSSYVNAETENGTDVAAERETETETETEKRVEEIRTLKMYDETTTMYPSTSVNVRSGPGTNYIVTGNADQGEAVTVSGETTEWYQVKRDGKTGYIHKSLLTEEYTPVYLTMTGTCYMRSEADYGDNIIGEYYAGTTVEFLGDAGGWYRVRVDGQTGYMGARFFE